jgi:hypothetical protein
MITKIDAWKIKHQSMLEYLFEIVITPYKANQNKS